MTKEKFNEARSIQEKIHQVNRMAERCKEEQTPTAMLLFLGVPPDQEELIKEAETFVKFFKDIFDSHIIALDKEFEAL